MNTHTYRNFLKEKIKSIIYYFTKIKNNQNKVIIFTRSRSGSNLLKSLMNQHPDIYIKGEIFGLADDNILFKSIDAELETSSYLYKVSGFKFFYYHPINSSLSTKRIHDFVFAKKNIIVIHLVRRDLFSTVVSRETSLVTGKWTNRSKVLKGSLNKIKVNEKRFIQNVKETVQYENGFNKLIEEKNLSCLELYYEDLVENIQETMNLVFDYVNVKKIEVNVPYYKSSQANKVNFEDKEKVVKEYEKIIKGRSY